ncbi:MAG: protein kinase domain-containing protein [Polyangiaceae bacterium]
MGTEQDALFPGMEVTHSLRLVRPLGKGGMGSVWIAEHSGLHTRVVVKFMADALAANAEAASRFSREAAAAALVKSPHVVHMIDHGVLPSGVPFIAMEYLEGQDLRTRLELEGTLPPRQVATLLSHVAKALARAHERGVVHRDIKPDNIFLCDGGGGESFIKVLDFGVAKIDDPQQLSQTKTGVSVGTPYYMSPEQMLGTKGIDYRTDLWSLGVVALEALTGRRPFDAETVGALAMVICNQPLPVPSKLEPALPVGVDAWFARACARDVEGRFASAKELADAFELAVGGQEAVPFKVESEDQIARAPTEVGPSGKVIAAAPMALASVRPRASAAAPSLSTLGAVSESARRVGASGRSGQRRGLGRAVAGVLATALVAGLGVVLWTALRAKPAVVSASSVLPARDRRVAFVAENRGGADDAWMAPVIQRMAARRLEETDLRVRGVADPAAANVIVHVGYRREGEGVALDATIAPKGGAAAPLGDSQGVRGDSIGSALEIVRAALLDVAAAGQAERAPDEREQREMKSLGAPSFAAYRSYQALVRDEFGTVHLDIDKVLAEARELVRLFPGWARAQLVLLFTLHATDIAGFDPALAEARASVHGEDGVRLLDAVENFHRRRSEELLKTLQAEGTANPDDPVSGFLLFAALGRQERTQEAIAVIQRLHEKFPELQFGSDLEESLRSSGRAQEAAEAQAAWLREAPDNEQALTSQIPIDMERDDLDAAVQHAERLVILFGASGRLAQLADVETVARRLHDASKIANRMLASAGQERAEGWQRLGRIAILEGRFSDALQAFTAAASEGRPYGENGPTLGALSEMLGMARVVGTASDVDARFEALLGYESSVGPQPVNRGETPDQLERRLLARTGACPDLSALRKRASEHPNSPTRNSLRVAAAAGCIPCADVLRAGLGPEDWDQRVLFDYGMCAETEGALELARDTFRRVERVETLATSTGESHPSTSHAVLARLHLARVLVRLGKRSEARGAYEDFLKGWGHAERPLTQVDEARRELAALGDAGP